MAQPASKSDSWDTLVTTLAQSFHDVSMDGFFGGNFSDPI